MVAFFLSSNFQQLFAFIFFIWTLFMRREICVQICVYVSFAYGWCVCVCLNIFLDVCTSPYSIKIHKFGLFYLVERFKATFLFSWLTFLSSSVSLQDVLHKITRSIRKKRYIRKKTKQIHSIAQSDVADEFLYKSIICIIPLLA